MGVCVRRRITQMVLECAAATCGEEFSQRIVEQEWTGRVMLQESISRENRRNGDKEVQSLVSFELRNYVKKCT